MRVVLFCLVVVILKLTSHPGAVASRPGWGASSRNWSFSQARMVRGGGDSKTTPDWLDMDRETLQNYMSLARERHSQAVQAARQAYYSSTSDEDNDSSAAADDLSHLQLQSYGIIKDSAWSLPDFTEDFDTSSTIFTTQQDQDNSNSISPLFTAEECQDVIQRAESHFEETADGVWTRLPSGEYDVAGFWIKDLPQVHEWFNDMVKRRLFPLLAKQFPDFISSPNDLVVDDAYLFKYTPETGRQTGVHTDSGCVSFTVALNGKPDFEGGGTWFEGLINRNGDVVEDSLFTMGQGHVTVRPGGVRHCGHAVTKGTRYIIGGFCMHSKKVEYVRMLIGLGSERASQGKYQDAQEALEAAIAINSNFDGAYTHLADALKKQGKVSKAKQVLEYCHVLVNPRNGEVAYTLGMMYLEEGQYDKANKCLEMCVDVDGCDFNAMAALAQICSSQGDTEGERRWYERITHTPGVSNTVAASAYCNLGILNAGSDEGVSLYQKALELVPDNFESRYSLASAYAMRQQWQEAAESYRLAVDTSLEDPEMQTKALNALYRVALNLIQADFPNGPTSKEEMERMVRRLQSIMGEENYKRLQSITASTS